MCMHPYTQPTAHIINESIFIWTRVMIYLFNKEHAIYNSFALKMDLLGFSDWLCMSETWLLYLDILENGNSFLIICGNDPWDRDESFLAWFLRDTFLPRHVSCHLRKSGYSHLRRSDSARPDAQIIRYAGRNGCQPSGAGCLQWQGYYSTVKYEFVLRNSIYYCIILLINYSNLREISNLSYNINFLRQRPLNEAKWRCRSESAKKPTVISGGARQRRNLRSCTHV